MANGVDLKPRERANQTTHYRTGEEDVGPSNILQVQSLESSCLAADLLA